jgi:hypothetical protein
MTPQRIKEIRKSLNAPRLRPTVASMDVGELLDLLATANEAARLRAENARLIAANEQWRCDAIAREQGRTR